MSRLFITLLLRKAICTAFLGFAVAILAPSLALGEGPGDEFLAEPARPADALVDSIAVATHWGFLDSIYATRWEKVHPLLGGLGVRTVRDALSPRQDFLWKNYGIRIIAINDDPGVPLESFFKTVQEKWAMIAAIEGPNEVNGGWAKLHKTYQGKGWPEGPRLFQNALYQGLKNDAGTRDIPVIAPSTCYKGAGPALAPLRAFDYANAHSYAGERMPSESLDFRDPFLLLGRGGALPPLVATESGYHTCLGGNTKVIAGSQNGISHSAQRKYLPRQIAEYFNAGLRWTTIYEFAAGRPHQEEQEDPEAAFGLLMPDDASPKPAYYALKDLIAALAESRWDAAAQRWIQAPLPPPRALAFALRYAPPSLHHTVLQRTDGAFQLLLWNEVPSFDSKTKRDLATPGVPVRLLLRDPVASITVTRLGPGAPEPRRVSPAREVDLEIPDEVVIVTVRLANQGCPAPVDPPSQIETQTTPTSVKLAWRGSPTINSYWITCNGRKFPPVRPGKDERVKFEARGLLPATEYPFQIIATAMDGGVSAPVAVSALTTDAFPDLVIERMGITPEGAAPGTPVRFTAVVKNIGTAPTEDRVVIGTKFCIDGKTICWNDTLRGPLEPGASAEVTASNGFNGQTAWTVTSGSHTLTAVVDDLNRIIESDESNNRRSILIKPSVP
jgi:hypothetical protein